MKNIPITFNYDQSKQIGSAVIDVQDEKLSELLKTGKYTFRAGFEILEQKGDTITKANLKEISLVPLPEKLGYTENYDNRQGKGSERATTETKKS